jgi:hypothetical protein
MGVAEGPGYVLLAGPAAAQGAAVAGLVAGIEVVLLNGPAAAFESAGDGGVSHVRMVGSRLPFASGRMAGVVLSGSTAHTYLEEGARVVGPLGRMVLDPAPADAAMRLGESGFQVLAREGDTVVASRQHR